MGTWMYPAAAGGERASTVAPFVVAVPQWINSPVPVTAVSASTLSRVAPYFTARGPPALHARLPPMLL